MSTAVTYCLLPLLGLVSVLPAAPAPVPKHLRPKSAADRLVGTWVTTKKARADRFPCELLKDGKLTVGEGESKSSGTYSVTEFKTDEIKLKIALERDGKPLPPEEATIFFLGPDRLVWYPEGQWSGVTLSRKR